MCSIFFCVEKKVAFDFFIEKIEIFRKLPPAEIYLNVCQTVACDQKLVYAKLQPPKSHFKNVRKNKEFFSFGDYFFKTLKRILSKFMTSLFMTLYHMQCNWDFLALKLIFCVEKNILNFIFLSKKLKFFENCRHLKFTLTRIKW